MGTSTFDFFKTNTKFIDISNLLDQAIVNCVTQPELSLRKSCVIFESLINKLAKQYGLPAGSLSENIRRLNDINVFNKSIYNKVNDFRIKRNIYTHPDFDDGIVEYGYTDSIILLKILYDILSWLVKESIDPKLEFISFEKFLVQEKISFGVDSEGAKEAISLIELPKFSKIKSSVILDDKSCIGRLSKITENQAFEIFRLALTTNDKFVDIENKVFGSCDSNGDIIYAVLNSYHDIGLTYSWKKYIHKLGISNTIKIIEENDSKDKLENIELRTLLGLLRSLQLYIANKPESTIKQ